MVHGLVKSFEYFTADRLGRRVTKEIHSVNFAQYKKKHKYGPSFEEKIFKIFQAIIFFFFFLNFL